MAINVPVPKELNLSEGNVSENWKRFETAWAFYEIATGFDKKNDKVRAAALLSVIGQEAVEVYQTFEWNNDGDKYRSKEVLDKFRTYCIPRSNVLFETYRFSTRKQGHEEPIDSYITSLRRISDSCEFDDKDRRIRDQIVLGMRDSAVRERILRAPNPDLNKVIDIIRASETAERQSQAMNEEKGLAPEINKIATDKPALKEKSRIKNSTQMSDDSPNSSQTATYHCKRCGNTHERRNCPAWGQECHKCKGKNHFSKCCKSTKTADTNVVTQEKKIYVTSESAKTKTFTVAESKHKITFQIDTGAEVNVIPLKTYIEITGDYKRKNLIPEKVVLVMYDKRKVKSMGKTQLKLETHEGQHRLDVTVADVAANPILSSKSAEKMNLLKFLDCDQMKKSIKRVTRNTDPLLQKYSDVFQGLGKLNGDYQIRVDDSVTPVIHAPRRVPVAIREELKGLLENMEAEDIIAKVTEPTKWVSSLMLKREPNKLRICLDPQDLNKAILREHHPLPTVEEVATRLTGARVFSVFDAKRGYWQVVLEESSSYLTTFNTPFGRYRWCRMPFGISSASEVFQRKMMEFAEGLNGVEVVADDFLIVGYGETDDAANRDHDNNLTKFLQKARVQNLKLNCDKTQLRLQEITFIGHILTKDGIKVDPRKVSAIVDMPKPEDEAGLRRFLGMTQYLSKFLPHLTNMTEPLRALTGNDSEWNWGVQQDEALQNIKLALCHAPVLAYYDVDKEVTIQCDASQGGLGAVLLQEGKPVAYTSRAMSETEKRYAQIEKETLAILHSCTKFEQYIYGRRVVKVESDHKPLETIFRKPIDSCPKRLQRMRMALQKYSLDVKFKSGKELYIADTLSRAHLKEVEKIEDCDILSVKELLLSQSIQAVTAMDEIPNSERRTEEIRMATKGDALLTEVIKYVREGWPTVRKKISDELKPFYDVKEDLTEETGLLFKGTRVIIPRSQRREVMDTLHESHMGIEGTLRRAREYVYWPNMNNQMKDLITKCEVCAQFRSAQQKETLIILINHEVPERAWCHLSADMFEYKKETFLIVVDHFSNYFEYDRITSPTAYNVIFSMKKMFSRFGIPEKMVTDNGPQFANEEFRRFAKQFNFNHATSSPHHPQSNGKAESAVKICKTLMKKALEGKQDFFLALLDFRNTPTEATGLSPAQRMFSRRTRTLLPTRPELLKSEQLTEIPEKLKEANQKQKRAYDKRAKDLPELKAGDTIMMKLPNCERWSEGKCIRKQSQRSYLVNVNGKHYVRNRRQLIWKPLSNKSNEPEGTPGDNESNEKAEPRRSTRNRRKPSRYGH